jgi:ClpP class serine protease
VQEHNARFLEEIRKKRGNPILPLFVTPITRATVDNVYNIINSPDFEKRRAECKNKDNVDVIIDSGGGDADAAYHIAKLLHRKFKGKITYIIPRYAKSAATLLVSGGDLIIMGPTSELGPLDPQIPQDNGDYISAKAVQSTLELIKKHIKTDLKLASVIASRLNPLVLGQYESTLAIAKEYQKELLFLRMFKKDKKNEKIVDSIVQKFAEGYTHHSRIIDYEEADICKLKIEKWDDKEWRQIWDLYMSHTQIMYLIKVMKILEKAKEFDIE